MQEDSARMLQKQYYSLYFLPKVKKAVCKLSKIRYNKR